MPGLTTATVPGITAMQDLAARSGTVLCEGRESLALLPLTAGIATFRAALASFDTVVGYKSGRHLPEVLAAVKEAGRLDDAVHGASLGLPGEDIRPAVGDERPGAVSVHAAGAGPAHYPRREAVTAVSTGRDRREAAAKVWFVGAGPGAADLLTLRAARVIAEADVVIWAASLVHPDVLEHARPGAEVIDSAQLPLEGVRPLYERARDDGLVVARIHSGDPALWGAVQEQRDLCDELGLPHETIPGVSAYAAVAAMAGRELTVPEVAQSVVLTRLGGGKTPMPPGRGGP